MPSSLRRAWSLLRDPVGEEKRSLLSQRWSDLASDLRLPGQGLGQKATGCGATIGIQPKCDFSCTGCYLGDGANRVPSLPLASVVDQLNRLRAWLGPKSNVQITDGEVTLRPIDELISILRHASSIGIVPMVMTHGDQLRSQRGLLERLMSEGHLTEISIHIDVTQRGRNGYRLSASELELMPLRDEFADLIRAARRSTRRRLRAAMTMTVTTDNLSQISDVVRWTIENRDAFSLLSFQPLAHVGRTHWNAGTVTRDALWREVQRVVPLTPQRIHFGHPDCTTIVPLLAIQPRGRARPIVMQLIRDDPDDVAVMQEFFALGLGGAAFRDDAPVEMVARAAGMLVRAPRWWIGRARSWALQRLRREAAMSSFSLLTARIGGVTLASHHFMNADGVGDAARPAAARGLCLPSADRQ